MSDRAKTPRTDACFEEAQALIRKYGTRDGVGPAFHNGNPWLLARQLEREMSELKHDLERAMANHNADLNK